MWPVLKRDLKDNKGRAFAKLSPDKNQAISGSFKQGERNITPLAPKAAEVMQTKHTFEGLAVRLKDKSEERNVMI